VTKQESQFLGDKNIPHLVTLSPKTKAKGLLESYKYPFIYCFITFPLNSFDFVSICHKVRWARSGEYNKVETKDLISSWLTYVSMKAYPPSFMSLKSPRPAQLQLRMQELMAVTVRMRCVINVAIGSACRLLHYTWATGFYFSF